MQERDHIDFEQYRKDLDELSLVRQDFRNAVQSFSSNLREEKLFDQWSLKDILAHFSAWAELTTDSIERARNGDPIPMLLSDEECDEFNLDETLKRKSSSWDAVYNEFINTENKLLSAYQAFSKDNPNDTLVEFITFCIGWDVKHYRNHLDSVVSTLQSI